MCFKWTDHFIVNCQDSSPKFSIMIAVLGHFFRT